MRTLAASWCGSQTDSSCGECRDGLAGVVDTQRSVEPAFIIPVSDQSQTGALIVNLVRNEVNAENSIFRNDLCIVSVVSDRGSNYLNASVEFAGGDIAHTRCVGCA